MGARQELLLPPGHDIHPHPPECCPFHNPPATMAPRACLPVFAQGSAPGKGAVSALPGSSAELPVWPHKSHSQLPSHTGLHWFPVPAPSSAQHTQHSWTLAAISGSFPHLYFLGCEFPYFCLLTFDFVAVCLKPSEEPWLFCRCPGVLGIQLWLQQVGQC